MALGDVLAWNYGRSVSFELLASATATNGAPSGTNGLALTAISDVLGTIPAWAELIAISTAGSGTMNLATPPRIWLRVPLPTGSSSWIPMGPGADATKGQINATAAIGEVSADKIAHMEPVQLLAVADRIYCELTAISGTSTAITAYLVFRQPGFAT